MLINCKVKVVLVRKQSVTSDRLAIPLCFFNIHPLLRFKRLTKILTLLQMFESDPSKIQGQKQALSVIHLIMVANAFTWKI